MTAAAQPAPDGADEGRPTILQPAGWPQPRGYSNGMTAEGRVVVTGGVVGWDPEGRFPDGFAEQARQVFSNIRAILAEGRAEPHHLLRLTWYVTDIDEYLACGKELGRAYREIFGQHYPAMAVVQVVRLVERQAKLEIEATAVVPPYSRSPG
jgi:enamine deaminase RidA (YjgF/YER057c/UK114 family)